MELAMGKVMNIDGNRGDWRTDEVSLLRRKDRDDRNYLLVSQQISAVVLYMGQGSDAAPMWSLGVLDVIQAQDSLFKEDYVSKDISKEDTCPPLNRTIGFSSKIGIGKAYQYHVF